MFNRRLAVSINFQYHTHMDFTTAPPVTCESRSLGGTPSANGKTVSGYAAKFNTRSENLGTTTAPWFEEIAPGAFPDLNGQDVRALVNHNPDCILARSKRGSGSLTLRIDAVGLHYQFEAPDTQVGRDLLASIKRGDIDQSSFSFMVEKDEWSEEGGVSIRRILKISTLLDVSPVAYPAYESTSVSARQQPPAPAASPAPTPRANGWKRQFEILQ